MNESLTGLEQHEGEYLLTEFKFLGELTLYLAQSSSMPPCLVLSSCLSMLLGCSVCVFEVLI